MEYVTGTYALNKPCSLETPGDWHSSQLNWSNPPLSKSEESCFGMWGIEMHEGEFPRANHIRAVADLIELGHYGSAEQALVFLDENPEYIEQLFCLVAKLIERYPERGPRISQYMGKEFSMMWLRYLREIDESDQS